MKCVLVFYFPVRVDNIDVTQESPKTPLSPGLLSLSFSHSLGEVFSNLLIDISLSSFLILFRTMLYISRSTIISRFAYQRFERFVERAHLLWDVLYDPLLRKTNLVTESKIILETNNNSAKQSVSYTHLTLPTTPYV